MAGQLLSSYDKEGDMLEVALEPVRPAIAEEPVSDLFEEFF